MTFGEKVKAERTKFVPMKMINPVREEWIDIKSWQKP